MVHSTDPEMNAALEEDAAKLEAMGQDPGPTLKALEPYKDQEAATFPVMEIFGPTIQGEGSMIGVKTMFVRFGGCDYRCAKCDSMHAVLPALVKRDAKWMKAEDIAAELHGAAMVTGTEWVTLSGGNPAMWDLTLLVDLLHNLGLKIAVETQGSLWRDWLQGVDMLTISPKAPGMGEKFNPHVFESFLQHVEDSFNRLTGGLGVCIKIPVMHAADFEFVVAVDEILERRNLPGEALYWPRCDRYLSLGNDKPPRVVDGKIVDDGLAQLAESGQEFPSLAAYLLFKFKILLEDYFQDPRLGYWKFLPQLHTLVWDNKAGV